MAKGFQTLNGKKYYFNTGSGKMAVGWTTIDGNKYYFDKETGVMATGDVTIDGQKYHFNSNGILSNTTSTTGSRTIRIIWQVHYSLLVRLCTYGVADGMIPPEKEQVRQ